MAIDEHLAILNQGLEIWNKWRSKYTDIKPNLSKANFEGINLEGINLCKANLSRANLSGSNLSGKNLEGTNLRKANLNGANLRKANLGGADLSEVDLEGINLEGTNFCKANLSGANLSGVDLEGINIEGINLYGANLCKANLRNANLSENNLEGTNFCGANLSGANLNLTNLEEAQLERTNLKGAKLSWTNLEAANICGADLSYANLSYADLNWTLINNTNLQGATLCWATLRGANLRGADLSKANLRGADLRWGYLVNTNISNANISKADLSEANLRGADLSEANLRGANLRGADLSEANLRGADLRGADLSEANLRGADLRGADLSGICIQNWNTNSKTNFTNVTCSHIFLKEKQQERRPEYTTEHSTKFFYGGSTPYFNSNNNFISLLKNSFQTNEIFIFHHDATYCIHTIYDEKHFLKKIDEICENNSEKITGVFLYTNADEDIKKYVQKYFKELHKLSGKWCEIYVLETENKRFNLFPRTPDKSDSYEIAKELNIEPNTLPCLVFLKPFSKKSISRSQKIIIPLSEVKSQDYLKYFRNLFTILPRIIENQEEPNKFDIIVTNFEKIQSYLEIKTKKDDTETVSYKIEQITMMIVTGDINMEENRVININDRSKYIEEIKGGLIEGNKGTYVQGDYFGQPQQSLAQSAAEIRSLLQELEKTYPTTTTSEQMEVAAKVINQIESNPPLKNRVIKAVKEGSLAAFEKAIDNPAGAFIVGAIKGWQEVEEKD